MFEDFFRSQFPQVVRYVRLRGANHTSAEDAAQASMIAVLRYWNIVKNRPGFVRRVAYRHWVSVQRKAKTELDASKAAYLSSAEADDLDTPSDRDRVYEHLGALPYKQRLTAALILDGLSLEEVAQTMRCPPSTVRSNARHATDKLKDMFSATRRTRSQHDGKLHRAEGV